MSVDYSKKFASNASSTYTWSDSNYLTGWGIQGSVPPTYQQFDALQNLNDEKSADLNSRVTNIENMGLLQYSFLVRQKLTTYAVGDVVYLPSLGAKLYLECTTAGTTPNTDLTIASPAVGNTVQDGSVVWTIRKIGSGDGMPIGAIIPFSSSSKMPAGYLECNGAAVSRAMFPDLYALIGTKYGAGDGSTTFNLPNYKFISDDEAHVFGNGKNLAFSDGNILFGPRTSSTSAMSYTTSAYGKDIGTALTSGTELTSGKVAGVATKALLGATPENSGLIAELSTTNDTVYIIKAFDGQTPDSALIDITQYAQALADLQLLMPPGAIVPSAANDTPDGYLFCDGSAVSRTTYAALFSAIGTTWGSGDGSTTFNLPNLNDVWLKGSSTAGSSVSAGLPNITGGVGHFPSSGSGYVAPYGVFSGSSVSTGSVASGSTSSRNYVTLSFSAKNSNSLYGNSTTVQPPSKTVRFIIKY